MQTTSAPMAWLFLQENVQVQYLQKIALRAENKRFQSLVSVSTHIIFCVSNFLLPLRQLIFRIERRAIEAQRLQSIFTLSLFFYIEAFAFVGIFYFCVFCEFCVPLI
jgi:hypothetical protein